MTGDIPSRSGPTMTYWCGEQLVVTIDGPGGRRVVELAQPFARIGSHPEADVVIADEAVELRAAYLHATPAGVFCLYLDIETQDLEQKGTWLRMDEQIAIGPYWLSARLAGQRPEIELPAVSPAAAGTAPLPLPVLLVYCGSKLKDKRRLRSQLSPLGRRPQCALQLRGEKVSGFHCVLFWEQVQLWFVDLNSSNGTQLNGETRVAGRVQIGDRLEVGDFGLLFQRLSSSGIAPPPNQPAQQESPPPAPGPAASPEDATLPAAVLAANPTATELAREAEYRRLREEMEQEVSRLAHEREEMHRELQQSSQQLVAQIGQLHDEASRLTHERQALEQSRHEWQAERAALTEQLTERSNQLSRLEAELAAATRDLADKLAQVEARTSSLTMPALKAQVASQPEIATTVRPAREPHPAVAPAAPPEPAATLAPQAAVDPAPANSAASELTAEDEKTAIVPEDWLDEADTQREPTTRFANSLAAEPATDSISPPMAATPAAALGFSAEETRLKVSERDQLPQFVSDRLVNLDHSDRRQQLLWWSAGGISIVALIALAVTIWMWAF